MDNFVLLNLLSHMPTHFNSYMHAGPLQVQPSIYARRTLDASFCIFSSLRHFYCIPSRWSLIAEMKCWTIYITTLWKVPFRISLLAFKFLKLLYSNMSWCISKSSIPSMFWLGWCIFRFERYLSCNECRWHVEDHGYRAGFLRDAAQLENLHHHSQTLTCIFSGENRLYFCPCSSSEYILALNLKWESLFYVMLLHLSLHSSEPYSIISLDAWQTEQVMLNVDFCIKQFLDAYQRDCRNLSHLYLKILIIVYWNQLNTQFYRVHTLQSKANKSCNP